MKRVPNALTVARMLVTPVLILCLFRNTLPGQGTALALFAAAALSDYFDGRLARSLKAHSRLGRFLDPMADKILVLGTFIALAMLHPAIVPWWAVAVIAVRDLLVTVLRLRAEVRGRSLKTLPLAKLKTTVQLVFIGGMLLLLTLRHVAGAAGEAAGTVLASPAPFVTLMLVVLFTAVTGLWYMFASDHEAPTRA